MSSGTRYPQVGYGFQPLAVGTTIGFPHGVVPWDGDFGDIVRDTSDPTGVAKLDFLSLYEVAMSQWLGRVFTIGSSQLPVVFAKPKQAFSTYWYALPPKVKSSLFQSCGGGGSDDIAPNAPPPQNIQFSRYPLPFISFHRSGSKKGQYHNPVPLRNLKFLNEGRTATGWSKFPTPYELEFQISLWSKYRAMHNWLLSALDSAFSTGIGYLTVPNQLFDDGEPVLGAVTVENMDEATEDATEESETLFRWVISLKVEALRFYEVRSAPVTHDIDVQLKTRTRTAGSPPTVTSVASGGDSIDGGSPSTQYEDDSPLDGGTP